MSGKCAAYWRALDLGKECGAPKFGSGSRRLQDEYREGVVPDLVAMGLKEDIIYDLLHYTNLIHSAPAPCILKMRRDSTFRRKMLDLIFEEISSGKSISRGSDFYKRCIVRDPELNITTWETEVWASHYLERYKQTPKMVRSWKNKNLITPNNKKIPETKNNNQIVITKDYNCDSRTSIIRKLRTTCTVGQFAILQDMVSSGFGEDEYAAFCIAIKWAAERLEKGDKNE